MEAQNNEKTRCAQLCMTQRFYSSEENETLTENDAPLYRQAALLTTTETLKPPRRPLDA